MTVAAVTVRRVRWPLAVLVAAVVAMFLLGFPLRTYVEQRASLSHANQTVVRLAADNRSLHAEAARLQTPAEIERLARQRYGLVRPGQEEYAILPAPGYHLSAAAAPALPAVAGPSGGSTPEHPERQGRAGNADRPDPQGSDQGGGLLSRFLHQLEFWS